MPGAVHRVGFDNWYPGFLDFTHIFRNSISFFTETALYSYATPHFYTVNDFPRDRQQLRTTQKSFGYYASADYQLGRRWFLGGRYDHSDRSREDALTDKGGSVVLTYWPSEFSQLRGQYRFTRYANNIDTNELFVQLIFSLGAHGAHPF